MRHRPGYLPPLGGHHDKSAKETTMDRTVIQHKRHPSPVEQFR